MAPVPTTLFTSSLSLEVGACRLNAPPKGPRRGSQLRDLPSFPSWLLTPSRSFARAARPAAGASNDTKSNRPLARWLNAGDRRQPFRNSGSFGKMEGCQLRGRVNFLRKAIYRSIPCIVVETKAARGRWLSISKASLLKLSKHIRLDSLSVHL